VENGNGIVVVFADISGGRNARPNMNGRWFDGRYVEAVFLDILPSPDESN
jgi:hypothetical protein